MGQLFSNFLEYFSETKCKILMMGLDAAGKTTILYQMKLRQTIASVPTVGFNVEEVKFKGLNFIVWDVGLHSTMIKLWHHYFAGTEALIYVIDSSDVERIPFAATVFENVINYKEMPICPILVLANKIDKATLMPN